MNIKINTVKIATMVPLEALESVRNSACNAGAGVIGDYTFCSTSHKVLGTFKPNENANPYIGEKNKLDEVEEYKLEVICDIKIAKNVVNAIRDAHPYEEPGIDIIPLIDENDL